MPVSFNALPVLQAPVLPLTVGQRLMLIGTDTNANGSLYGQIELVESPLSAYALFGECRLQQAIGEAFRQGVTELLAVAIKSTGDIASVFDSVSGVGIDLCVIVDITATPDNCALLGKLAYTRETEGTPLLFVVAADLSKGSTASDLISYLPAKNAGFFQDSSMPNPIVFSRYLVITPDFLVINPDTPIQYTADAAPSIAGLLANLPPFKTITNVSITNSQLNNPYSASDAAALANNGYITLRNSANLGLVVNYGVTATSTDRGSTIYSTNMHNIASFRTCQYVVSVLQQQTQDLIGNAFNSVILNNAIAQTLYILRQQKIVLDATFTITINQVQGAIYISLNLVLATETSAVNVTAQLGYIR